MATLYILQGFIGSGKTTFSTKLASQIQAVRLNADEWVDLNCSDEQKTRDWPSCFSKAVTALWQEAGTLLGNDKDVILDFGFWDKASRAYARQKAHDAGATFKHIYIYAPDDVLRQRISKRSGPIAEKNIADFYQLKEQFQEPSPDESALVIDTSKPDSMIFTL